MVNMLKKETGILFFIFSFLLLPGFSSADYLGQQEEFFIDESYDLFERDTISATLKKISDNLYFYLGDDWWNTLNNSSQLNVLQSIKSLDEEFSDNIYPELTSVFGSEAKPGIDNDDRITVLIFPMKEIAGGYVNNGDGYSKIEWPRSNEQEIVYLNSQHITSSKAKSLLAHEFTHLIVLNQKEKILGIEEEIWLNEARAEYAPTLVGYDNNYQDSNLQSRVETFLKWLNDPVCEWQGKVSDYGALNMFVQYLVDQYGVEILVDSLHFSNLGIPSLNYALKNNGFKEDFNQVFTDWTIAVLINDCSVKRPDGVEGKYCYRNPNLESLKISPSINFLPMSKESELSIVESTKDFAGNWYKIIGGKGTLNLKFDGADGVQFRVPIVLQDALGSYSVMSLELDEFQKGVLQIKGFGEDYGSLTLIPQIQDKIYGFNGTEPLYRYFWKVSTTEPVEDVVPEEKPLEEMSIVELKAKIAEIMALISQIR